MARFNEIQVGRYNRYFQKLFSMKGDAPAPQLSSEIGIELLLFHGVETRYLEGWDRYGVQMSNAAVAATVGSFRLRNPSGSNVVAVIEKLLYVNSGTLNDRIDVFQGPVTADLATLNAVDIRLDSRGRTRATTIISQQAGAAAGFGTRKLSASVISTGNFDFIITENQEFPLLPGDGLHLESATANNAGICSFFWRERFLEDSERA